ncbi:MAG TPA: phosphoribosyltransferase family protein [Gammaproteobacteria bacterium]|nr:phosphoribosyltransferase family protein [Gammaproteobacteria bacterium]
MEEHGTGFHPPGRQIFSAQAVQDAIQAQARELAPLLAGSDPLVLVLMQGALYYAAWLTVALARPLELDYIHATRYGPRREGDKLHWIRPPPPAVEGRKVLLLDDIFDEGLTLYEAAEACRRGGAESVVTAVLALKRHDRAQVPPPDSVALDVPDAFVVGCGLDDNGRWRNLAGIYTIEEEAG